MIKPITSIADLLFKVKTEIPYQHLLIVSVRDIWSHLANEVQSIESAIKIVDDYCAIVRECSALVSNINAYRNLVNDPADEEFNKLFVLKDRRADTAADDARPSMRFNGENLTINNSYQRTAEEYERMRRRSYSNQNAYIVATQQQRRERLEQNSQTFSYAAPDIDYEILERLDMTPAGERITVCRRVPRNIPHRYSS